MTAQGEIRFSSFQWSITIYFNALLPDMLNIPSRTILTKVEPRTASRYTHMNTEEARL
jgi:hypothetical protein